MDPELEAMQAVLSALAPLNADGRERVIHWAAKRFDVTTLAAQKPDGRVTLDASNGAAHQGAKEVEAGKVDLPLFDTLGELFSAAGPKTNGQKALVVGYWLQSREGLSDLDAQRINTELKHLGYGVANITNAMEELKAGKPAMVIQLKKSGTSKQARKKYKVTEAGMKAVEAVLRGEEWK